MSSLLQGEKKGQYNNIESGVTEHKHPGSNLKHDVSRSKTKERKRGERDSFFHEGSVSRINAPFKAAVR